MWKIVFKKKNKKKKKPDFTDPDSVQEEPIQAVVYLKDRQGRIAVPIRKNGKVTLGRKAEVTLREEVSLADIHMVFWYDQGRYWIEKGETENTLKFNGRVLEKGDVRALYNGAVLEIGMTKYQFMEE